MNFKSDYYKMFFSIIINNFGDVLFDLFIVWEITQATDNIMSAVYMIGSSILFRAVLSIFIGVLVDRFNKKNLVIISNMSSICVITILAIFFGKIQTNIFLGIVFILLNDINNEVFFRSSMLISAEVFDKETFVKFQAKYSIVNRIVIIAGSSIVGFLMSITSNISILMIAITSFLLSGLLVFLMEYQTKKEVVKFKIGQIKEEFTKLHEDIKCMGQEIRTNEFITRFIIIMFILNLAYGYIPYILPIKISTESVNPTLLGLLKSSIAIGEIIGLAFISKFGEKVSFLFKVSMLGNAVVMVLLGFVDSFIWISLSFFLYGVLDSFTQPLFGYTISMIDERNRGKIIGGIDALILISPSLGMFIVSKIMEYDDLLGYFTLAGIFMISYFIINWSTHLKNINLKRNKTENGKIRTSQK